MKLFEVTAYNLKSQQLLNESWETLTESQRLYIGRWEKELWPLLEQYTKLCEATLTPAQIQQIFQSAEEVAMASGDNTSTLGKVGAGAVAAAKLPVELAKQVNAKIDELGRLAQKAGPVKAMDQKFDQLKNTINKKFPDSKILDGISEIGIWAKENPGKASLAIGILTTIAALAGGPAGGAAAGLVLRGTKDLLTGEKLSTAIGKSVKTAAYGAIAGWALEGLGDWLEGLRADAIPYEKVPGLTQIDVGVTRTLTAPGFSLKETLGSMVVPADQADNFIQLVNNARGGDVDAFKELWSFTKSFDIRQAAEDIAMNNQVLKELALQNDQFLQNLTMANNAIAAIAQGTITGKMDSKDIKVDGDPVKTDGQDAGAEKKESVSMEDKYDQYLQEGPLDAIKRGAASVGGAIKTKAAAVGKELGNKVTVSKLMKQWKSMGEPTDTGSIMNILQSSGMSNNQITQIGQSAKVDLGSATTATAPNTQPTSATASTTPASGSVDLKSLADEIKKAGPEVIEAVKAMLSGTTARTGGKVAGKLSTAPRAVSRRQATAAKKAAPVAPAQPKPVVAKKAPVAKAPVAAKPKYANPAVPAV
jgi:hypothetical protein